MSSIVVVYLFIFFITCVTKFCICFELVSRIKKPKKRSRKKEQKNKARLFICFSALTLFFTQSFHLSVVCVCVGVCGGTGCGWHALGYARSSLSDS